MDDATTRRLALVVTGLVRVTLVREDIAAAGSFAVVIGMGVAMPVLLAGAYPVTQEGVEGRSRVVLALAEVVGGIGAGALAVVILLPPNLPNLLPVGGGAASTYLGAAAARAVVLSREGGSGPREREAGD